MSVLICHDIVEDVLKVMFIKVVQVVVNQHTRGLAWMSQLAADRAKEKLKAKIDKDKIKIASLEAELARLRGVNKDNEDTANQAKTDLAKLESLRHKLKETLASAEHTLLKLHSRFQKAEQVWNDEFTVLANHLNEQQ